MEENSNGFGDWRVTVFWLGIAAAAAIAGVVFGWEWRGRTGALADVSLLQVMTAFGTVGAVVAATYFAVRDARNKQRREILIAQLTAAGLDARLSKVAFDLGPIIKFMREQPHLLSDEKSREDIKRALESMLSSVSMGEVVNLAGARSVIAFDLMRASNEVRVVAAALGYQPTRNAGGGQSTSEQLAEKLVKARCLVLRARAEGRLFPEWG